MILHKKSLPIASAFLFFAVCTQIVILAAGADISIYARFDRFYTYLIVPPFICGLFLIDEGVTKPIIVRMKSRFHALMFLLTKQYIFALVYTFLWFAPFAIFAQASGSAGEINCIMTQGGLDLISFLVFINIAALFKRFGLRFFSSIPYVTAYLVLILDVQAIPSISTRLANTLHLVFSWTFYRKSSVAFIVLFTLFVATFGLLVTLDRKADIF